jgi:hypothetical protein
LRAASRAGAAGRGGPKRGGCIAIKGIFIAIKGDFIPIKGTDQSSLRADLAGLLPLRARDIRDGGWRLN